ncbi:hypothetical protein [Metabacillus endolithicus]|nr:hypothetical protein [Metabacillus endolithicus]UPG65558.1 hypothetical protein MVE64_11625 [Metabacillus endolithicus]
MSMDGKIVMDNYGIIEGDDLKGGKPMELTFGDFLTIVCILIVLYVIYRLSKINYQLNMIIKHLGADKKEVVPNDEIEKELERELKK